MTTLSYMILEVCWDGLWTLSFGLSQFRGHDSWLMCEVALIPFKYASLEAEVYLFMRCYLKSAGIQEF